MNQKKPQKYSLSHKLNLRTSLEEIDRMSWLIWRIKFQEMSIKYDQQYFFHQVIYTHIIMHLISHFTAFSTSFDKDIKIDKSVQIFWSAI